jgi:hypothetical protein
MIFSVFRKRLADPGCKALVTAAALLAAQVASAADSLAHDGPWYTSAKGMMVLSGLGLMGFVARRRKKGRDEER